MITIKTYMSLCQWDPLNIWEPATKVSLWRFFLRVLLLIVRRNGHKEVVKVWFREETIFPVAFWFLNLEIWLWKRLSFASTRPKRPMGGRPSRILGQGYSRAGTFYCVIYSVINRERVVQSLANNRSKYTKEKSAHIFIFLSFGQERIRSWNLTEESAPTSMLLWTIL